MKKGRTNEKKERKRKTSGGQTARKKVPVRFLNNSRLQQPQRAAAALLTYAITAVVWQHATATLDSATFPEARTKPALVSQQRRSRTHASLATPPTSPILLPPSPPHTRNTERETERDTHRHRGTRQIRERSEEE
jgi:hypothetical protein